MGAYLHWLSHSLTHSGYNTTSEGRPYQNIRCSLNSDFDPTSSGTAPYIDIQAMLMVRLMKQGQWRFGGEIGKDALLWKL